MKLLYIKTNILEMTAAKKGSKMPAAQLKKMQDGLKKYRAQMDKLRSQAAKTAKITPAQFKKYLAAMKSPECMVEGRLAGVAAAEKAGITDAKFKAFTKAYKKLRDDHKAKKSESKSSVTMADDEQAELETTPAAAEPKAESEEGATEEAEVSDETQELLEKTFDVATFLNLIQSDKFYDWYAGPLSSWLAEEEGAPSDDKIVQWVVNNLQ